MAKVAPVEVKSTEPKAIADRLCLPSPMDAVRAGMKFFIEQESAKAIIRQDLALLHGIAAGL